MEKRIVVLGSTGSIGTASLDVIEALGPNFRVEGLVAGNNWSLLAEQSRRMHVPRVAIADESHYTRLKSACGNGTRVLAGPEGLLELVDEADANFVLAAIVGAAGLPATLKAVERGIDVGLANKEALVVAGSILMPLARQRGARLIPVDSEHSAIFQSLHCGKSEEVARLYLTASGGPFRTWEPERIAQATLAEALRHPTWSMGPKITIDSATMMNKALEIIEARFLFDVEVDRIDVIVHPESIVHSMVEFVDGSVIAQLGTPNMRTPIQYALTFPGRARGLAEMLDWRQARTLRFEPPDLDRFPALRLGFEAARRGGTAGAVLNAANEAAVEAFRAGRIRFGRIAELAEQALSAHRFELAPGLAGLMEADAWARQEVERCTTHTPVAN